MASKKRAVNKIKSAALKRFWAWKKEGLKRGYKGEKLKAFIEKKRCKYVMGQLKEILPMITSVLVAGFIADEIKKITGATKKL
jgi:hypothetical protein